MKRIVVILIVIIVIIILFVFYKNINGPNLKIITEKEEYNLGGDLKINITNHFDKKLCFSSCYPYYFEKKSDSEWTAYQWLVCKKDDLIELCIDLDEKKGFNLIVDTIDKGAHRIAVPVCIECDYNEEFRPELWFYSNEFIVK